MRTIRLKKTIEYYFMMMLNPKLRLTITIILLMVFGRCALIPSKVCWRDFYHREAVAKGKCEKGKTLFGFLCYEQCPASMPMTQFDCIDPYCPGHFYSQPTICYEFYDRPSFGTVYDSTSQEVCEREFGRGGCTTWFLHWMPKCKNGYQEWYTGCRYQKTNCTAYGFKNPFLTSSPFCIKDRLYITPTFLTCPEDT